jgi:HlyD family secretion protein
MGHLNATIAALLLASIGCNNHETPKGYQGIVEYEERHASFDLPGKITSMDASRGQKVTSGQILAHLDDQEEQQMHKIRLAELEAARAQAKLLHAGSRPEEIRETIAQLNAARVATRQLERNLRDTRELARVGAAPTATVKDLEDELSRARANAQVLAQRLSIMRQGARAEEIRAADARVDAAAAALEGEAHRLARYELHSPVDGYVLDIVRWPGEVVGAGATVVQIADTTHPYIDAFVPQGGLGNLPVGTAATIRVDSLSESLAGTVEYIASETEFTPRFLFSEKERPNLVVRVRVRVSDPKRALHAGIPAFVTFDNEAPH